jgi:hypothetical protein
MKTSAMSRQASRMLRHRIADAHLQRLPTFSMNSGLGDRSFARQQHFPWRVLSGNLCGGLVWAPLRRDRRGRSLSLFARL